MNNEYIAREAAIEAMEDLTLAKEVLESLPAAEVRELVKATKQPVNEQPYFRKHHHRVCCSNCHREIVKSWKFCPDCGATFVEDGNGK